MKNIEYSLKITELINKPIIRNDKPEEFLNKMTDEEIKQWENELEQLLLNEGFVKNSQYWDTAFLARTIDRGILYDLLLWEIKKERSILI